MIELVHFPVDDPRYHNSGEGGMFVHLVVGARRDKDLGGYLSYSHYGPVIQHGEVFVRDDVRDPEARRYKSPFEWFFDVAYGHKFDHLVPKFVWRFLCWLSGGDNRRDAHDNYGAFHFPYLGMWHRDQVHSLSDSLRSVPYHAALLLDSTAWSGYNNNGYWHCTYDDLTVAGKALYNALKDAYPNCDLYLLTWLDT